MSNKIYPVTISGDADVPESITIDPFPAHVDHEKHGTVIFKNELYVEDEYPYDECYVTAYLTLKNDGGKWPFKEDPPTIEIADSGSTSMTIKDNGRAVAGQTNYTLTFKIECKEWNPPLFLAPGDPCIRHFRGSALHRARSLHPWAK